jgi:hemoglobin
VSATGRAVVDLGGRGDIHDLVVRFYREVVFDDLLAPMFGEVAEVVWARVLLGDPSYRGALLATHRHVHELEAFRLEHFDRWYLLWTQTIDESWAGPLAEQAKSHAARVGATMSRQLLGVTWQPDQPAAPRRPSERTPR